MFKKIITIFIILAAITAGSLLFRAQNNKELEAAATRIGLVGHWTMDTQDMSLTGATMYDKSGFNNNGTVYGTTTSTGKIGQARSFNGTSNYVNLGAPSTFNFGASNFSFSVWIKLSTTVPPAVSHGYQILSKDSDASPGRQIIFSLGNDQGILFAYFTSDGAAVGITSNRAITDMNWHHVVGQRNGNSFDVYIDGTSAGSGTTSGSHGTMQSTATNLDIGRRGYASYLDYFPGQIDDVRIYNRALTAQEVSQLYNSAKTTYTNSAPRVASSTPDRRLVGWWTMDANDINGTTVYDKSGQNNHGTGTNITSADLVTGKISQALDFNGSSEHITVTRTASLESANITLSTWIKPTSLTGRLFNKGINALESYLGYSFIISDATNVLIQMYGATSGLAQMTIAHQLRVNEWAMLTMTYDGTTTKLYKNGIFLNQSTSASGNITHSTTENLYVGSYLDGTFVFNGKMDDVRVYNYALSATEVANLYSSAKTKYTAGPPRIGLVGYWTMDTNDMSATGATAYDNSGLGNDGIVTGTTTSTGKIGQARYFNGTSDSVKKTTPSFTLGTGDYTISIWVKGNTIADAKLLFEVGTVGVKTATYFYIQDATSLGLVFGLWAVGYPTIPSTDPALVLDGRWHLLTGTKSGTTMTLYLDGVQKSQKTGIADINIGSTFMTAGAECSGACSAFFTGSLDDARVYNRALSADEVSNLYQSAARNYVQ